MFIVPLAENYYFMNMQKPDDLKKIRARIRRYERNWKKPDFDDGAGTRFLTGPLYLLLGDTEGALAHYKWYAKKFEDSSIEPFHALGWALTMYRSQQPEEAVYRLRCTHCANVYMLPTILKIPHGQPDVSRGSNWQDEEYIKGGPLEFLNSWQKKELAWLKSVWESTEFQEFVETHKDLVTRLSNEPVGQRRFALVNALHTLSSRSGNKRHGSTSH